MSTPALDDAAARTDLAWQRSGLSIVALGAVVFRGLQGPVDVVAQPAVGLLLLAIGVLFSAMSLRSARRRAARARTRRPTAQLSDLAPLVVGTSLGAAAALVVALLHP